MNSPKSYITIDHLSKSCNEYWCNWSNNLQPYLHFRTHPIRISVWSRNTAHSHKRRLSATCCSVSHDLDPFAACWPVISRMSFIWGLSDVSTSELGLGCAFSAKMLQKCLSFSEHPWCQAAGSRWRHHAWHCEFMTIPPHVCVQWEEPRSMYTCSTCLFVCLCLCSFSGSCVFLVSTQSSFQAITSL